MKKASVKIAILIPTLISMIVGIGYMGIMTGNRATAATDNLTSRLIEARVNEYANEFQRLGDYNYGAVNSLQSAVETLHISSVAPRTRIIEVLNNVLETDSSIFAVWTAWEPNALDGKDAEYINADEYHDSSGRFVPYLYRDGGAIKGQALLDYDDPVAGEYYQGAKLSGKPYITDPYQYTSGGSTFNIFSIAIPILRDGAVIGAVGVDVTLEAVEDTLRGATILDDGYFYVLSPNGNIAVHENESLVFNHYSTTWMGGYTERVEGMLVGGDSFDLEAYSDVTNENMQFLGNGIIIGDTGRNWGICGVIPSRSVNEAATNLVTTVLLIGAIVILVVGIVIYLLINSSLKRLPSLTAIAENVANGNFNFNTEKDDGLPTKNEITLLQRSFVHVVGVLNNLIGDLNHMSFAIDAEGDIDARLDISKFNGAYKEVAESTNKMLSGIIGDILSVFDILIKFGDGDFNASMANLPGKKKVFNEILEKMSANLISVNDNINSLVRGAIEGKLSNRIDTDKYKGDWAKLMGEMNSLMEAIAAPIAEASEVMTKVSEGNFKETMKGNYNGEFLSIKESINTTVKNISSYIDEISSTLRFLADNDLTQDITRSYVGEFSSIKEAINHIFQTLNSVIGNITAASVQVSEGAKQISESSTTLAEGASKQASAIEQLNATVTIINENTGRTANFARQAEELSAQSTKNALDGNSDMKEMLNSMEGIKDSSEKITRIIKTIEDIAFQTNLLSLNAAVEAARAGEHGKGFAVVAEEVRTLSGRSSVSAKETAQLIQESIERVEEGSRIAVKTAEALNTIMNDAAKVGDIISNISISSQEQAESISQVTEGISQITNVVQANSSTSEESAAASQELSSQSDVMMEMVRVFKLKK
ncbi:MAG: methyl-accepting chemotaxis protein [Clostridiales bacterium]|jgi:methyl-accepting chemotaxis protein|nr:methyl-accepting chemotaxis protein [Clostridiales bacterium]